MPARDGLDRVDDPAALQRFLACLVVGSLVLASATVTVGCTAGENEDGHNLYVWPLADILHSLETGEHIGAGVNQVLQEGIPATSIIAVAPDGKSRWLQVEPAFVEARTAAYVTTDAWLNIPQVWLQPAYVQVANASAMPTEVAGAPILIDVEHRSLFYSPFWNVELAVVGAASSPDRFDSTRQLLDTRPPIAIRPGGWWNYPIAPDDFLPTPPNAPLMDPTWGFALDPIPSRAARFNGKDIGLLDFGRGTFTADSSGLVEAHPFFVFARRNGAGNLVAIPAPRVAGVGPLWSGRPATLLRDPTTGLAQPKVGMFWLLVAVSLPADADAFHADAHPVAVAATQAVGYDIREVEGRVALHASCFDDPAFLTTCTWLDSQSRIEGTLGSRGIFPTKLTVNSIFVSLDRVPVHR